MLGGLLLRRGACAAAVAAAVCAADPADGEAAGPAGACAPPRAGTAYTAGVLRALRSRRDLWGERLLRAPEGPTYEAARRFLHPLLLARAPGKRPLTASGFHYVPFSMPLGAQGAGSVALHVADGGQVVADRVGGRTLTVFAGGERYGSCLRRLTPGSLADGWLPILLTAYVDAAGNRWEQESFAGRLPGRSALASFVRVTVEARRPTRIRLVVAGGGARSVGVPAGATRTLRVAWERGPALPTLDEAAYAAARSRTAAYWRGRLAEGASVEVPERVVSDAYRAVLAQNLALTWRYSIGNPYEQFSFPEGVDAAQVAAEWGHAAVSRSILRTSLTRKATPYPNWKMGEKLVGSALHWRLTRDRAYVRGATPRLRAYVEALGRQLGARGLLARERYSSDIPDAVYGLHSQAVAWQGLREMAAVWSETGSPGLARRARALAGRLERGLRRAVAASQRRLGDGSLFVPIRLLDGERPYGSLTEARLGSYWNLVMPYALASGLFRPGSPQAEGVFRYLRLHGSRLLGLVRAGAYALYREPRFPTGGTDEVYGINVARFLADNGEADQLLLGLYGQLAAAMTPGTFVGGEAASVAPLAGAYHRAAYLPPNGASNAAFLTKLRLLLVHETRDARGRPHGLRLAFATPRAWLEPGKRVAVRRVPTSFGPVSYELDARPGAVHVSLDVPARGAPRSLRLRLRLPRGTRIAGVTLDGRPYDRVEGDTIDLTGRRGRVELVVATGSRALASAAARPRQSPLAAVRRLTIRYRAHNGARRTATVVLPAWYGDAWSPPLPLVISPHGRGVSGRANAMLWGDLPGKGSFALVSPDGQGRRLPSHSWGYRGQIADLARMPAILGRALPWLRIDRSRVYAFGGSMGGQETLLLLARRPRLLAGAAVFDSVTDLAHQYRRMPLLSCGGACRRAWRIPFGVGLQRMVRREIGGAPGRVPSAFAARSPMTYVERIARSCVPLQLWWSVADRVVTDQGRQSGRFFWELRRRNPHAPVQAFVGFWRHSAEMRATSRLPLALRTFGLLEGPTRDRDGLRVVPPPGTAADCVPG